MLPRAPALPRPIRNKRLRQRTSFMSADSSHQIYLVSWKTETLDADILKVSPGPASQPTSHTITSNLQAPTKKQNTKKNCCNFSQKTNVWIISNWGVCWPRRHELRYWNVSHGRLDLRRLRQVCCLLCSLCRLLVGLSRRQWTVKCQQLPPWPASPLLGMQMPPGNLSMTEMRPD